MMQQRMATLPAVVITRGGGARGTRIQYSVVCGSRVCVNTMMCTHTMPLRSRHRTVVISSGYENALHRRAGQQLLVFAFPKDARFPIVAMGCSSPEHHAAIIPFPVIARTHFRTGNSETAGIEFRRAHLTAATAVRTYPSAAGLWSAHNGSRLKPFRQKQFHLFHFIFIQV